MKCGILARPTKSLLLYMQSAGRLLRPWEGVVPVILDHAGCAREHGLPHEDREYSLDEPPRATRKVPLKRCPKCGRMQDQWVRQCQCGHQFAVGPKDKGTGDGRVPGETSGKLEQMTMAERNRVKQERLDVLCASAVRRNYRRKLGWVGHRFFEEYSAWPDKTRYPDWFLAAVTIDERASKFDQLRDVAYRKGYSNQWVMERYVEIFGVTPKGDGLLDYAGDV